MVLTHAKTKNVIKQSSVLRIKQCFSIICRQPLISIHFCVLWVYVSLRSRPLRPPPSCLHRSPQSSRFSAHLLSITHHQTDEQFVRHTCTSTPMCTVHTHTHTHGWINLAALHTELLCTHSQRCYRSQNVEIFLHMSGAPGRAGCLLPREAWLWVRAPPATFIPPPPRAHMAARDACLWCV